MLSVAILPETRRSPPVLCESGVMLAFYLETTWNSTVTRVVTFKTRSCGGRAEYILKLQSLKLQSLKLQSLKSSLKLQ